MQLSPAVDRAVQHLVHVADHQAQRPHPVVGQGQVELLAAQLPGRRAGRQPLILPEALPAPAVLVGALPGVGEIEGQLAGEERLAGDGRHRGQHGQQGLLIPAPGLARFLPRVAHDLPLIQRQAVEHQQGDTG